MNEHLDLTKPSGPIPLYIHTPAYPSGRGPYDGYRIGAFAYRRAAEEKLDPPFTVTHLGTGRRLGWAWAEEDDVAHFLELLADYLEEGDVEPHWPTEEEALRALRPHKPAIEELVARTGGIPIED